MGYHVRKRDRFCDATADATPPCEAWIPAGHPFHGCCLSPNHKDGDHKCKCGTVWKRGRTVRTFWGRHSV